MFTQTYLICLCGLRYNCRTFYSFVLKVLQLVIMHCDITVMLVYISNISQHLHITATQESCKNVLLDRLESLLCWYNKNAA